MPIGARVMRRVLRVWKLLILGALRGRRVNGMIKRERRSEVVVKLGARLRTKEFLRKIFKRRNLGIGGD